MPFPHDDIRGFLEDLDRVGELARVKQEVDWNLEVGAIYRRLCETGLGRSVKDGGQPAPLFENIKGYPGWRMSGNILANRERMSMAMGARDPGKASYRELQDMFAHGLENQIKPILVRDAPCKENRMMGDQVNLYRLPAPYLHDGDGGRYLATGHLIATKDPDSDWMNWGTYRAMVHDKRSLGILLPPWQHIGEHYARYEARNEPMPFAIAIGPDPVTLMCAYVAVPHGVSEVDVVGGLRGTPLKVVKCETNDLLVPAGAEVVIEGIIPPGVRAHEGPFGEYTGYRASPRDRRPVGVVRAVTWRNDPIFYIANPGLPVWEPDIVWSVAAGAIVKKALQNVGIPVVDVNLPPECGCQLLVVTTRTPMARMAFRIASAAFSITSIAGYCSKLLVLNDDVDAFNLAQVVHAWVSKTHPVRGQHVYYHPGSALAPYGDLTERYNLTAPQALYDATWPTDWPVQEAVPPKASFPTMFPEEVRRKVLENWSAYGFR